MLSNGSLTTDAVTPLRHPEERSDEGSDSSAPSGPQNDGPAYLYTGKELDAPTSFYYYGARYYNPAIAKFIQPDPIIQDVYDPQSLNHYAYARNNPLVLTDPTGMAWQDTWNSWRTNWNSFNMQMQQNWRQTQQNMRQSWENFRAYSYNSINSMTTMAMQSFSSIQQGFSSFGQRIGQDFSNFRSQMATIGNNYMTNIRNTFDRFKADNYYTRTFNTIQLQQTFDYLREDMRSIDLRNSLAPQKLLGLTGKTLSSFGYSGSGKIIGAFGTALEPGGYGKMSGMIVGGTTFAILGARAGYYVAGQPGAVALGIAGGIYGGYVGGKYGTVMDPPDAGYLNYGEEDEMR